MIRAANPDSLMLGGKSRLEETKAKNLSVSEIPVRINDQQQTRSVAVIPGAKAGLTEITPRNLASGAPTA